MQKLAKSFKPEELIEIIVKRRWFIIIPFCLSILIGIYLAFTLPRIYGAGTLILVEPQRVPTSYVQPLVSSGVADRISTISQQIMSRSNLEKIISEFKLFSDPGQENMFMEDKIESLRKRITVTLTRARGESDAFSISFKGKYPEKVVKVANALATYFIDENLKVREAQAVGTNSFLETELSAKKNELEKLEEVLKQYRQKYMGELPEQLETNLRVLDRLEEQMGKKQEVLRDLRNSLIMLNNQQDAFQSTALNDSMFMNGSDQMDSLGDEGSEDLSQLNEQLNRLKLKYTDRHPDVVHLKRLIAKIEEKQKAEEAIEETEPESVPDKENMPELGFADLQSIQKEEMNRDIHNLRSEIDELNKEMQIIQKRVGNTPNREQELLSIKRDYENMNDSYNSLLKRKLEAEIAVNMEKQQKGEQFRILDYAQLPEKPISPNMNILFLFSLAGGLGVGCGLIFLLEYFNTSFRSPEDIESFLGIPVFATLPVIYHPEDLKKQRVNKFLSVLFIAISFILFSGFAILTFKGVEHTKELISRFI